ncbi:ABC transporter permease [Chitinophaga sp. 212800010-3]|uniref:ABC transporter permease n=1 Tax=unclassified Chitinophaga TaxID=2619133 RepID=UPI002DEB1D6D|nr:Transporter permease [Chitinophaga sp. 212800010-3]
MLINYLKVACRHLLKNGRFTVLNLIGLSTGLACALLIYLWVHDERSVDKFHTNNSHLFRVLENKPHEKGIETSPGMPGLLAETITTTMPEVVTATVSTPPGWFQKILLTTENKSLKAAGIFADRHYLEVFSYPLIEGNAQLALGNRNGVVVTAALAKRLFGSTGAAVGKTITWKLDRIQETATVTGVLKDIPANSSTRFDFLLPFTAFQDVMNIRDLQPDGPFFTYLVTKPGTDITQLNAKLSKLMTDVSQANPARELFLQHYSDSYLHGSFENGSSAGGRISYVRLFSLVALFIILIACVNFVNLSTAKASGRMKEMGVRKAIGANRGTLIVQYLSESMLITFTAMLLALLLVVLLLPVFNHITDKALTLSPDPGIIGGILAITLVTGLLAGSYPALYLSGFNPLHILKGSVQRGTVTQLLARKGLVVFQFTLSVLFLVAVITVYRQIVFIQSKHPGYDKDNIVYFDVEGKATENMPAFLAALKEIPGVVNASGMVGNVLGAPAIRYTWKGRGVPETILCRPFPVNYGMIETLGLEMVAGRPFSKDFATDSTKIIFNEAAIKLMGINDPVGKVIEFDGARAEILGVVKDFHFQSMHEPIKPLFFKLDFHNSTVMVKLAAGRANETISKLSAFYHHYNPGFTFDYKFLDEDYQAQYAAEQRVGVLSRYFTGLAILISCLGLAGLATYTAESRRKEISIRKVLGATAANISFMLSTEFLRAVVIAIAAGLPLAWYCMDRWLNTFAFHINVGVGVLIFSGGIILLISLCTVSYQSVRAALENPTKGLGI